MGGNNNRAILIFLGIGILAGFLASLVVGGGGLITYLVSGVIGSFVGGYLFTALRIDLGIRNDVVRQIVTSTVGAIIVVLLARLIA
ncbi:GlsB/YeaQ/YmgE family stress response membrane protein [Devosia oryziradicis]|uniref:GlsB/YeaQ/YmgE family stress response membrane protein n=1 Tax=Devosia oryziradicis TaxID=2801335 RepID=A0ABX7C183_9HYPH|nr:GlsB/YeaQ/YmgE family stress response membrane protein [Devosia oryziradicis]QQR37821.1 GlsB/YeaQ/YmgE family stress response membrane protein [Devosia oryziradicis]